MDDLTTLKAAWETAEEPPGAARHQARTALLEHAAKAGPLPVKSRPRRIAVRAVAVAALAVTIVAGTIVVQNLGGTDDKGRPRSPIPGLPAGPVASAADLLDRAARAADARRFGPPRPDQWAYIEHKQRFPAIGTRDKGPRTPLVDFTERTWWRIDGNQVAREQEGYYGAGKLEIENGAGGWKHNYPVLAALPTDPVALNAAVAQKEVPMGEDKATELYEAYAAILRNGVAPPKVEAAIFRAISTIPGITLKRNVRDGLGRPAVAVARIAEGYQHVQILIDPKTYQYLAERIVVIKDHTSTGEDGTWRVSKGAILNLETRTAARLVDKPGQRA